MGGKGNLVHLTGNAVDSNTQQRIAGVQQAVDETAGAVTLLTTVTDIDKDLQSAQKAVSDLLAAQGADINGIVTTAYNPAVAATDGVKTSGLPISVIAIDDDPVVLQAIKDGVISGTVVQNPWGQAYVGSWVLAALQSGACTMNTPGQTRGLRLVPGHQGHRGHLRCPAPGDLDGHPRGVPERVPDLRLIGS